jgi:ribosomal protein S18 acetylase RimI-like enzyme
MGDILGLKVVDVQRISGRQFEGLLQTESKAWLDALHWDYASSAELILTYLDQKRLSGFALLEDGYVQGYCLYFREGSKASIGDLFVEPGNSSLSQLTLLLERTIRELSSTPGVRRIEAQLPHYDASQITPFFRARLFQVFLRQFMALRLESGNNSSLFPEEAFPGGEEMAKRVSGDFLFQPWERRYDREAAYLLNEVYRNHIDAALNDQYRTLTGTSRLIESIVRYRGCGDYLQNISTVAIHRSTGKLAAALGLTAVRDGTAHVPQIATASGFQGLGLGTAMLRSSFQKLLQEGYSEVSLTVTSLNARAVRLYERLGFKTLRVFGAFAWDQ